MTSHPALLLPLCTSAASLGLSLFSFPLLSTFLPDRSNSTNQTASQANNPLSGETTSHFWSRFGVTGPTVFTSLVLATTLSGGFSSRWLHLHHQLETTTISQWYLYGAVAAAGHFAFAPVIAGSVQRITAQVEGGEAQKDKDVVSANEREIKNWIFWQAVRTVTVDVAAVVCFAKAVALSMWVV